MDALWKNFFEEEFAFRMNKEDLPKNYEETIEGNEGERWKAAMDEEIGTFAVNKLAQFTQNPRPIDWTAVKRIFCYLKYTRTHKLTFGSDNDIVNTDFNIFCNANWASDTSDSKSISGYIITMAGGAVSWSLKKQTSIVLSTAEAEYIAATMLPSKYSGNNLYSQSWTSTFPPRPPSSPTIKWLFQFHITPSFIHT